jgi:hypothetical protein
VVFLTKVKDKSQQGTLRLVPQLLWEAPVLVGLQIICRSMLESGFSQCENITWSDYTHLHLFQKTLHLTNA